MSDELEQIVRGYDTPYLLEQFYRQREEYSPEALGIMEREIERRQPSDEQLEPYRSQDEEPEAMEEQQFVKLDDTFSQTDLVLVHAILRDSHIPFFVDNPDSSVVPLTSGVDRRFSIHIPESEQQRVHELLDQHFHREEGQYRLRHTDLRDRLRAFSFSEVRLTETQLEQEVDTALTPREVDGIVRLGRRLLEEVEQVEREQERVVFHYDAIEGVLERLDSGSVRLSVQDLLTIVEILQIYCDDPAFPPELLEATAPLLDLFDRLQG